MVNSGSEPTQAAHLGSAGPGSTSAGAITYLEAITAALVDAMRADDRVFCLGEDIGHFGGAFGVTKGLLEEFGPERVLDMPIAEEGFVGAALGAAWMGERPIVELQFADFSSCAFDPIVTVAAKTHWRSGLALPVVIRAPSGGGIRGGPFHASCPEGWFAGTAGLKVVCPGSVADAYGLLRSAIEDDDPVLFFEHKALYRRLRGERPGDWPDRAIIENNSEGTIKPIRALVKGRYKYVYVHERPDQLFDLARDPHEWRNIVGDPASRDVATAMRAELMAGWDPVEEERRVLASQLRRTFLKEALFQGAYTPWDYQPTFDATRMWVRRASNRQWDPNLGV